MNVIYNLCVYDKIPEYYTNYTRPRFNDYASKVNAKIETITQGNEIIEKYWDKFLPQFRWLNKLILIEIFLKSKYEKMVFFDNDVVILKKAINLFEYIQPCSFVAGTTEWLGEMKCNIVLENKHVVTSDVGQQRLKDQNYVFNSGVLAFDRETAQLLYNSLFPLNIDMLNKMDLNSNKSNTVGDQGIYTKTVLSIPEINVVYLPPYCHAIINKYRPQQTSFLHVFHPPKDKHIKNICKEDL
jgi:alpha-N-acetylglucosamine transferase